MFGTPSPNEYFDDPDSIELEDLIGYLETLRSELDEPAEEQFEYDRALGMLPQNCRDIAIELFQEDQIESELDDEDLTFDIVFIVIQTKTYESSNGQYTIPDTRTDQLFVPDELLILDDRFRSRFEDRPMYNYIESLIYFTSSEKHQLQKALESSYLAAQRISNHPNVAYMLAESLKSFVLRYGYDTSSELLPEDEDEVNEMVIDRLGPVTDRVSDPRYKAELSQSLKELRKYDEALQLITEALDQAIEQGDGDLTKYFNSIRTSLHREKEFFEIGERTDEIRNRLDHFESKLEEFEEQLEGALRQTLQFIAFFAAILTVVLTSVQISANASSFQMASMLILILIGGILVAFSGFGLLFRQRIDLWYAVRLAFVTLIGVVIIFGSIIFSAII